MDIPLALTFDDVLIVPRYSPVRSRSDVDTTCQLAGDLVLKTPVLAANMDTVCRSRMGRAMAREGGIGVIHRFMTIEEEADEVRAVKRPEGITARKVHTIAPHRTIDEATFLMGRHGVNSLLVVDGEDRVIGIVTSRDILLAENRGRPISEVMTGGPNLVSGSESTTLEQARDILYSHRIEKLPILDAQGRLKGMITGRDVMRIHEHPDASRDKAGKLLVAAAVGAVGDYMERAAALVEAGVDLLVLDIAHGHSEHALKATRDLKQRFPHTPLMGGNVATAEGTIALIEAGADAVKVGVGPGAACSTRLVAGVGVPQLTAVMECARAAARLGKPVCADGGIRYSGDITKAVAAGASTVMIGSLLAGTEESPGQTTIRGGARYKVFRGMASTGAAEARRALEQSDLLDELVAAVVPEGVEAAVPYRGTVRELLHQLMGGLRSGMSYVGATTPAELRDRAQFVRITEAGFRESKPHDLTFHE